jgi:hypothetical protein
LIAHYGLRLSEAAHEKALRKATIKFLDIAVPRRDPAEFDDIVDTAELLLDNLERKRGGLWPIEAAINEGDSDDDNRRARTRQTTTIQVERSLGKQDGRGVTDDSLLLLLAVLIVATETTSRAAATKIVQGVFAPLGLPAPDAAGSAQVSVSRTNTRVSELIAGHVAAGDLEPTEVTPRGAHAAYVRVASDLADDARVTVPAVPADLD